MKSPETTITWGAIAVTVVSYAMWYPLVRRYAVNQTMPFTLLVPVFGVASSAAMLGDRLTWQTLLGGAATMKSVTTYCGLYTEAELRGR